MSSTTAPNNALLGQSAIVTGASRGIGLACARILSRAGARVVLVARTRDALAAAQRELGEGATPVICDLADARSVSAALEEIEAVVRPAPDIVVNNAGLFALARIEDTTREAFEAALRVNLASPFAFVQRFLGAMRQRRRGHIVTVGSIADHQTYPENAAYAASKFGARALHEVLRLELRGSGVRATLVSPGPVDTALWDEVDPDARAGFTPRAQMLGATAVADAVYYAVSQPDDVNVDELRLSRA
jgi:NADP-dependent 3-hydroxy acid dehydrogenase YdfG